MEALEDGHLQLKTAVQHPVHGVQSVLPAGPIAIEGWTPVDPGEGADVAHLVLLEQSRVVRGRLAPDRLERDERRRHGQARFQGGSGERATAGFIAGRRSGRSASACFTSSSATRPNCRSSSGPIASTIGWYV